MGSARTPPRTLPLPLGSSVPRAAWTPPGPSGFGAPIFVARRRVGVADRPSDVRCEPRSPEVPDAGVSVFEHDASDRYRCAAKRGAVPPHPRISKLSAIAATAPNIPAADADHSCTVRGGGPTPGTDRARHRRLVDRSPDPGLASLWPGLVLLRRSTVPVRFLDRKVTFLPPLGRRRR